MGTSSWVRCVFFVLLLKLELDYESGVVEDSSLKLVCESTLLIKLFNL